MRSVCLFCLFLLVIHSEALNQADFKEPLAINQQIPQKQVFPFPLASSPAPVKTSPSPMSTTPAPVKTNHAPLPTTPTQVNTSPSPVSTSPAPTTPKAPVTDEFLGPSECLDKKRTRSSCDLVFCPPWERCIEGKCSCKPPYLCPVENTRPVCGRDHRNYRSYCQAMAVSCRTKKPTMSHFGENCHASLDKFLSSIDQDSGLVSMFLPNSDGGSDEVLVCQKLWDMAAANVACREQGKSLGAASVNSVPFDSLINKPDRCVSVRCQGYETSLSECVIYDKVMSRYGRVAAVSCYEAQRKPKECGSDFQCANSKCVSVDQTCDGVNDCGDRSDEMCCKSCRNGAFRCKTGVCLHGEAVNDGQIDCLDGEDEAEKHKKKTQTSFRSSADPEKILQQLGHSEFVSPRNETKSTRDHLESLLYCGVPNATTVDDEEEHRRSPRVRRVVGGVPAKPTQIQWQVALVENKRIDCGGAYIGGCWVITAAHCVRPNPSAFKVKFSIWKKFHIQTTSDIVPIEDIRIHPNYNPATYENDIALIQLQKRPFTEECFVKNPAISAVCIPWTPQLFQPNHTCSISGWGRTADGRSARVLLWANVSLIADCQRFYKDRFKPGMMCAGDLEGSVDSCQGDSGGPLVCEDELGVSYLWGIVSWGDKCGMPGFPGVYTQVAHYFEWIRLHTGWTAVTRFNS
ncbi:complement factor I isoform X2 [Amphiprion ocellaris]|uniref:Complement factor I n=1 Tax=Amphiprion ocellaris TaxID=80972 RepID=A0A3Q1DCM0_AMPOC|nr:complement factor I isoform X2 [Amphiprion ocellaris]